MKTRDIESTFLGQAAASVIGKIEQEMGWLTTDNVKGGSVVMIMPGKSVIQARLPV